MEWPYINLFTVDRAESVRAISTEVFFIITVIENESVSSKAFELSRGLLKNPVLSRKQIRDFSFVSWPETFLDPALKVSARSVVKWLISGYSIKSHVASETHHLVKLCVMTFSRFEEENNIVIMFSIIENLCFHANPSLIKSKSNQRFLDQRDAFLEILR
jgi:hypothetical protein